MCKMFSNAVTAQKSKIFIEGILRSKNGATFQRRINVTIVRACFKVHTANYKHVPVFTLTFASDDNASKLLIDYYICRNTNVHELIQEFKCTVNNYMCVLAV